jgi:hypothetical protein
MIISIEGPEKAGKSTLVKLAMAGFEKDRSRFVKCSGRDDNSGFGYMADFAEGLDSRNYHFWDRAWIGEYVYGTLLKDGRLFADDPFMCEWFYGRALNGRGGKFVLLPDSFDSLPALRDETDLDVDPYYEAGLFREYAQAWGYEILRNNYDELRLMENAKAVRKSAFVGIHKCSARHYVGPLAPTFTFVGNSLDQFRGGNFPFFNMWSAEYFRGYGDRAINEFGYASLDAVAGPTRRNNPHLFERMIAVGPEAARLWPLVPNVPWDDTISRENEDEIDAFHEAVAVAMRSF